MLICLYTSAQFVSCPACSVGVRSLRGSKGVLRCAPTYATQIGPLAKADDLRYLFAILPQIPSVVLLLHIQRSCRVNHGNLTKVRVPPKDLPMAIHSARL